MLNQIKNIKPTRIFTDLETGATFNFFILAFFTFMGTSLPFQERLVDAYEAETTNIINQIVYIFLFILSSILIVQNPKSTFSFIRKEKYLTLFISFCLISFLWSGYGLISFKRSFQLFVTFITILNAVLYMKSDYLVVSLKIIAYIYIIVTLFSVMFIPQAIDPAFGSWRGIELQKNLLGHTSLMIFTLGIYFLHESKNRFSSLNSIVLLLLSILIIVLSDSSTNMIGLIAIVLILIITNIDKFFSPLGVGRLFSKLIILSIILASIILSIYSEEILSFVPGLFGKDLSFTGRDLIWAYIWTEIQKKFWLGYGYGSYWIMGTSVIDLIKSSIVGNRVNEAHNGFLEIMLQTGIFGFTLFVSVIVSFVYKITKTGFIIALFALVSIAIVNFTESFIFQPRSPSTLVFMLFYLLISKIYFKSYITEKT